MRYFSSLLLDFEEWLARLGYAKATIAGRKRHLSYFLGYLESLGIHDFEDLEQGVLEDYNKVLHSRQTLSSHTIKDYLGTLKVLNRYLESYGEAPVLRIKLAVMPSLPIEREILTLTEIRQIYSKTGEDIAGSRDKAILGLFYGCGLRSGEGRLLKEGDINLKMGLLHVSISKTGRGRYVPMSKGVMGDLREWLSLKSYFCRVENDYVLPNKKGKMIGGDTLNDRLRRLCERANIEKRITLHCLRHSIATHLLESGMPIEQIARFLGHKHLESTQHYAKIITKV